MTDLRSPVSQVAFAVYREGSGAIICNGRCALRDLPGQGPANGGLVIEGDWPFASAYVDLSGETPVGRMRPSFPAFDKVAIKADGSDAATMALPIDAVVTIDGTAHDVPAGPLRFTADSPGNYVLDMEAWPYLPSHVVVEAA